MKENQFSFNPGTFWDQIKDRSGRAKKLGALHAIQTTSEFVQQNNLQFLVRIVSNLAKKAQEKIDIGKVSKRPWDVHQARQRAQYRGREAARRALRV